MYRALKEKFSSHDELKELLLQTNSHYLVEHTDRDDYWGDGSSGYEIGDGLNKQGELLMKVSKTILLSC